MHLYNVIAFERGTRPIPPNLTSFLKFCSLAIYDSLDLPGINLSPPWQGTSLTALLFSWSDELIVSCSQSHGAIHNGHISSPASTSSAFSFCLSCLLARRNDLSTILKNAGIPRSGKVNCLDRGNQSYIGPILCSPFCEWVHAIIFSVMNGGRSRGMPHSRPLAGP